MFRPFLRYGIPLALLIACAHGQANSTQVELTIIRQDMSELKQRIGELTMNLEQLTNENRALREKAAQNYVTLEQLNKAVAEMNRTVQAASAVTKREVLQQVAGQIERLGKQTNAALDALAKSQATRPVVQTTFSDNFPKEGINYTVVKGDTLSGIANKTGAKLSDIRNANKISDDTRIMVGQTLFIPQGK